MKTVLVANRGEIACRVIESCRSLGLRTVAVHSEADEAARHVTLADRAVAIGPAPARLSYLDGAAILAAARAEGADAVHPGYGFLSENAEFAASVEEAGLAWVGPRPQTIAAMGDKGEARAAAKAAGVPVLPGSGVLRREDDGRLASVADEVGYPLLVKAAAGGGGIGMSRVDEPGQLAQAVERTRVQAARAFGSDAVYLEHYVARARHVEIQVFGLGDGRVTVFPERDCSAQRRFQKIVEESPAPLLDAPTRTDMQQAAIALARRVDYRSAGTLEFVFDPATRRFYFLEMNTRIQVEHPVTEMATDVDLVALQLRLARGDELSDLPEVVGPGPSPFAIEARLYAESPAKGFLPRPGRIETLRFPDATPDLRIDCGLRSGDAVTPHYDPLVAKVIARGTTRQQAIDRLVAALAATTLTGIESNRDFLLALLTDERFAADGVHTRFVDENPQMAAPAAAPAGHQVSA